MSSSRSPQPSTSPSNIRGPTTSGSASSSLHWLPEEVPLGEDCRDWAQKLTGTSATCSRRSSASSPRPTSRCRNCYHENYGRVFKPTEVKMMLTAFSNMETVHIAAYSHLLDTIGMPESEYSACSSNTRK
jgi:ribonucleoside-diphosphate reductase beta chain